MKINAPIFHAVTLLFFAGVLAISAGMASCSENALTVGGELIPQSDNALVKTYAGSSLSFRTETGDTVRTDHGYLRAMGNHFDPVFGNARADLLMEITPEKKQLGSGVIPDSLVLYIQIDSIYGNTAEPLLLQLYRMSTPMDDSLEYFSTTRPDGFYDPDDLLLETTLSTSDTLLRLRIDNPALLTELCALDSSEMDAAEFKQTLSGLLFKLERPNPASEGAILYPSVRSTTMRMYYKNSTSSDLTWYFYPRIVVSCYQFLREGSVIAPYIDQPNPSSEMAFIQGMAGADMVVGLDDASQWIDSISTSGIIISKAELILKPKDMSPMGLLWTDYPKRLSIYYYENGVESEVMHSPTLGGYNRERNAYVFNLNLHFAKYLRQKVTATHFKIVPFYQEDNTFGSDVLNRLFDARRVVLDPSASGLQIFYIKPF